MKNSVYKQALCCYQNDVRTMTYKWRWRTFKALPLPDSAGYHRVRRTVIDRARDRDWNLLRDTSVGSYFRLKQLREPRKSAIKWKKNF